MSDFPKTYAKGDDVRQANTPSRAVALQFEGYVEQKSEAKKAPVKFEDPKPSVKSADPKPFDQ